MSSLGSVLEHLKSGKTIAYPTEGVWGLGCDPRNPNAIENLLSLKARSPSKGLILIASQFEHFLEFSHVEDYKDKLLSKWPGPHTWLVPSKEKLSPLIKGNNDKVALRLSNHQTVCNLCDAFGDAIVSTSANKEGRPTLSGPKEILECFPEVKVLEGKLGGLEKPSTIQDVVTDIILR
jgi:L-threonylcarbamoyladenylate synthase